MGYDLGFTFKTTMLAEAVKLLCAHPGMSARDAVSIVAEVVNAIEDVKLDLADENGNGRLSFYARTRQ